MKRVTTLFCTIAICSAASTASADVIVYTAWDCDTSYGDYSTKITEDVLNFEKVGWSETYYGQGGFDGTVDKKMTKFHHINDKILSIEITDNETIRIFKDKNFGSESELIGPRNGCYNLGFMAKKVSSLKFVRTTRIR